MYGLCVDQWSEDYVLFLLETIENPLLEDEEERVPDAFLNMILAFNQHFPGVCVCVHACVRVGILTHA